MAISDRTLPLPLSALLVLLMTGCLERPPKPSANRASDEPRPEVAPVQVEDAQAESKENEDGTIKKPAPEPEPEDTKPAVEPEPDPLPQPPLEPLQPKSFCLAPVAADVSPLANKGTLVRVIQPEPSPAFLEGALWIEEEQVLLASSMASGPAKETKIFRWKHKDAAWDPVAFAERGKYNSNGLAISLDKKIYAALYKPTKNIGQISAAQGAPVFSIDPQPKLLSPNDLALRSDGIIFFSDPDYQNENPPTAGDVRAVYRINSNGSTAVVDSTLNQPNGVSLSLDESRLFVGTADGTIISYKVAKDGTTEKEGVFADTKQGVDGMTIDCAGNLYATAGREIQIFDTKGKLLGKIALQDFATNVAFGGKDRKTLFITSAGALYHIDLNIPGWPY